MLSKLGLGKTLKGYVNIDCFDFTEWVSIDRDKPQDDWLFQPAKLGISLENIRRWARNLGEHLWEGWEMSQKMSFLTGGDSQISYPTKDRMRGNESCPRGGLDGRLGKTSPWERL